MKLGVMVELDENLDLKIAQMKELGFSHASYVVGI